MNITQPFPQLARERQRIAEARRSLGAYVGRPFVFHGPADDDRVSVRLYPEHIGRRCVVLSVTDERVRCPLLIVFGDGFRGIAEPGHLVPVETAEVPA